MLRPHPQWVPCSEQLRQMRPGGAPPVPPRHGWAPPHGETNVASQGSGSRGRLWDPGSDTGDHIQIHLSARVVPAVHALDSVSFLLPPYKGLFEPEKPAGLQPPTITVPCPSCLH